MRQPIAADVELSKRPGLQRGVWVTPFERVNALTLSPYATDVDPISGRFDAAEPRWTITDLRVDHEWRDLWGLAELVGAPGPNLGSGASTSS